DIAIDNTTEYPPTTAGTYTFDSTVTIPAGERIGTIEVIGDNTNGDIGSSRTYFRLSVKSTEGVSAGGTVTVGIKNKNSLNLVPLYRRKLQIRRCCFMIKTEKIIYLTNGK